MIRAILIPELKPANTLPQIVARVAVNTRPINAKPAPRETAALKQRVVDVALGAARHKVWGKPQDDDDIHVRRGAAFYAERLDAIRRRYTERKENQR